MIEVVLEGVKNDDNFYDFDVTGDLDAGDEIRFFAARRDVDLNEADALIKKGRNAPPLTGIADLDLPNAKFQVQIEPAETVNLEDRALVFKVVLRKVDAQMFTTVAKGVIQLTG